MADENLAPYVNEVKRVVANPHRFPKDMSKVLDHLYIGTYTDAVEVEILKKHGITHIINCVEDTSGYRHQYKTGPSFYGDEFKYHGFMSEDEDSYPIMQHFEETYGFIEDARLREGKCLIHCMAGINRSGVLAVAYVMVHLNIGPISAAKLVLQARGMILRNEGFIEQLVKLAAAKNLLLKDE